MRLLGVIAHLWQCSKCGAWVDTETDNGRCGAC